MPNEPHQNGLVLGMLLILVSGVLATAASVVAIGRALLQALGLIG